MSRKTIYKQVCQEIERCHRCSLYRFRQKTVPGEGNLRAKIFFIGEAPGAQENRTGRPFCGTAGKILDQLLDNINLDRKKIFITNLVKCRPPKNRPPRISEIKTCQYFLEKQFNLIKPMVIVALGRHAVKFFLGTNNLLRIHGKIFKQKNFLVMPTYHPAAALYRPKLKNVLKRDFEKLNRFVLNP
jgi:DNA polymerase